MITKVLQLLKNYHSQDIFRTQHKIALNLLSGVLCNEVNIPLEKIKRICIAKNGCCVFTWSSQVSWGKRGVNSVASTPSPSILALFLAVSIDHLVDCFLDRCPSGGRGTRPSNLCIVGACLAYSSTTKSEIIRWIYNSRKRHESLTAHVKAGQFISI